MPKLSPLPDWTQGIHHDGSSAYVSNPFPQSGDLVTLSVRVPAQAPINGVYCRMLQDGEFHHLTMTLTHTSGSANRWSLDVVVSQPRTEYSFKILAPEGAYYFSNHGISRADHPTFYDFLLLANYQAPHWVRDAVFYQIFPDRFHNGDPTNDVQDGEWEREGVKTRQLAWGDLPIPWAQSRSVDFAGGDLQGITHKLDYIAALGISALYLTPIFTAGSNHRYDMSTFNQVDPHLGGDAALIALRQALDTRNMQLVLDITPNHVGVTHHWFTEALANHQSDVAQYFMYDEKTASFETWLGVASLIKLNYGSQALRDEMYRKPDSAIRRWLAEPYRIDGWRLDVANMVGNLRMNQLDHDVWADMRPYVKTDNPDAYLLGEYFQDGTPHTQGAELDAAMNYQGFNTPTRRWLGGADLGTGEGKTWGDYDLMPTDAVSLQYERFLAAVPFVIALQQFNQLGSHDLSRILDVTKGDTSLVRLGVSLLMSFVGVPCLYYGDEIGMAGGKDPDCRRCMPWDDSVWDQDLLDHHKRWISLRRNTPALKHGGYQTLFAEGDTLVFVRETHDQKVIFVGHRGTKASLTLPVWQSGIADGAVLHDLASPLTVTVADGAIVLQDVVQGQAFLFEVAS